MCVIGAPGDASNCYDGELPAFTEKAREEIDGEK